MTIRHAIIGDVHGCGEELEELCEFLLEKEPGTRLVLTGDLLTKGPDPGGVVRLISKFRGDGVAIDSVCGNHDLRVFSALHRSRDGVPFRRFSRVERETILRLDAAGALDAALSLLEETVDRILHPIGRATVLHAGVDPKVGLSGTSPYDLIHIKAGAGERPWWETYDGRDGLLVFGHKPVREPVHRERDGAPIAINVDTGCASGGKLTAYLLEADRFVAVESRQSGRTARRRRIDEPASSVLAWAG